MNTKTIGTLLLSGCALMLGLNSLAVAKAGLSESDATLLFIGCTQPPVWIVAAIMSVAGLIHLCKRSEQ